MSLSAIRDDITVRQGSTWRDSYTCRDGEDLVVDLSGCSAVMHVRAKPDTKLPLLSLVSDGDGLVIDGPAGLILRTITDEETASMPPGVWFYDLFLTWEDGQAQCLAAGTFTVEARITHP